MERRISLIRNRGNTPNQLSPPIETKRQKKKSTPRKPSGARSTKPSKLIVQPLVGIWSASGEPFKLMLDHTKRKNTAGRWIRHGEIATVSESQIQLVTRSSKYRPEVSDTSRLKWHKFAHYTGKGTWEMVQGVSILWQRQS